MRIPNRSACVIRTSLVIDRPYNGTASNIDRAIYVYLVSVLKLRESHMVRTVGAVCDRAFLLESTDCARS